MKVLVRVLFAAVLVLFVGQVAVVAVTGDEVYPGIFQPAFGGQVPRGGVAVTREPRVLVTYADGSTASYDHRQVMAASRLQQASVFRSAFGPDSPRRTDPRNVRWLASRVAELGGGRRPTGIVVEELQLTRDLGTRRPPRVVVTSRDALDLGSARA